jgi:hypothetical protein
MLDSDFVKRVQVAVEAYTNDHALTDEEDNILTEFVEWIYRQYGIIYENKNG